MRACVGGGGVRGTPDGERPVGEVVLRFGALVLLCGDQSKNHFACKGLVP